MRALSDRVRLHKRVINAVQYHHRTQTQWRALVEKALYLEDVEQAETSGKVGRWSVPMESQCCLPLPVRPPENVLYAWHVNLKRPFFKACGIAFAIMTLLILWSECTFFIVHPQLSLAARILHGFAENYHYKYVQVAAIALISYMGMCAYYTVFKLRIYRYYQLDRCSDENSLIFSAMLLCRLTPPMCLNFLGMIHLDSHITSRSALGVETQFTQLMGHLDVIPILAKGINIYLPILIVLLCLGTWFQLGTRFLHSLGIDQFIDDDDMTAEMVQGGRALVALERNRINRMRSKEERNQAFSSRLQGPRQQESQPLAGSIPVDDSHLREYSDREPIIDHQDNAGLLADYAEQPHRHVGEAAQFPDLEFGGFAFDTTSSLPTRTDARNHPPPSNIFDDL
ncbi:LMBR1-like conserved region family protein [Aphelenchoides avenae]|nr:LMBR1-like conserved region family protein [Aphelenchus avenae]